MRSVLGFSRLTLFFLMVSSLASAGLVFPDNRIQLKSTVSEDVIVAKYPFTNTSKETVTVVKMESSCGCTVPELEKKVYAPGESGVVVARFSVGDRQGEQRKTITVQTNENNYPLTLLVTLPERMQAVPRLVIFRPADLEPKSIDLKFMADTPIEVVSVESLEPKFSVETEIKEAGTHFVVKVTATDDLKETVRGNIRVRTKGASGREYTDMLYARFAP